MGSDQPLAVARRYHEGWTSKNFEQAIDLLADAVKVEVPINDYPTADSFAQALRSFGSCVTGVDLLSEMSEGNEAMLLYDMRVERLGSVRVVEHFTIVEGEITRLRQIHDTAAIVAAGAAAPIAGEEMPPGQPRGEDYAAQTTFAGPPERIFEALTTLEGLAGWWTPLVSGDPTAGGQVEFAFAGIDERIVISVDDVTPPALVSWKCLTHTGHPEWEGTTIRFELGPGRLRFVHLGLRPSLDCYETCQRGWDNFLASLLSYAQQGQGSPF